MAILAAEDVYRPAAGRPAAHWAPLLGLRRARTISTTPPDTERAEKTLPAFVNDGRWVCVCSCGGAQVTARTDRRFWCEECRSPGWTDVAWPDDDVVNEAEAILSARPDPRSRNWKPWEQTVEDLAGENAAHGVRSQ